MDTNLTNPVKRAARRYFLEFGIAMAAYAAVLILSRWLLEGPLHHVAEPTQTVIALLPILPIFGIFAAVVRLLRRTDELYRRICIDSLALAGGITALLAAGYGLIENERLPHLSAWWTYATFMTAWIIATFFVRRRYR